MGDLFSKGFSYHRAPLKMMMIRTDYTIPFPSQAMFVVPKKKFRRAHDRNLLKRRMREAYRLNKQAYYAELENMQIKTQAAFIYTGSSESAFHEVQTALLWLMKQGLSKFKSPDSV
jgi:ribonuclease P protein component